MDYVDYMIPYVIFWVMFVSERLLLEKLYILQTVREISMKFHMRFLFYVTKFTFISN